MLLSTDHASQEWRSLPSADLAGTPPWRQTFLRTSCVINTDRNTASQTFTFGIRKAACCETLEENALTRGNATHRLAGGHSRRHRRLGRRWRPSCQPNPQSSRQQAHPLQCRRLRLACRCRPPTSGCLTSARRLRLPSSCLQKPYVTKKGLDFGKRVSNCRNLGQKESLFTPCRYQEILRVHLILAVNFSDESARSERTTWKKGYGNKIELSTELHGESAPMSNEKFRFVLKY